MNDARAWPRCRSLLESRGYSAELPSALFEIPHEILDEAWRAVCDDLSATGSTEAYRRALAEAATIPDAATPTPWIDSRVLTLTCLPVVLATAVFRSRLASGIYSEPDSVLGVFPEPSPDDLWWRDRDWSSEDVTWTFWMALRELFGEPEIAESGEDEVASSAWLDARRSFPSEDSPQVLRVVAELTEFQGPFDFSDPQRCQKVAEYWFDGVREALEFLANGTDPYEIIDYEIASSDWHISYILARQLDALDLSEAAAPFWAVAKLGFVKQPPPRWGIGMATVSLLIDDRLPTEALAVLEHLDPESYPDDIVAKLPSIPDEYEHAWGTEEEWDEAVEEWNRAYARAIDARRFECQVRTAEAYRVLGDIDAALATIPKSRSTEDEYVLVQWARLLGYLEGRSEASAQKSEFTMPAAVIRGLEAFIREQFKPTNAMVSSSLSATIQVGHLLEAHGELLLDVPAATADQIRQDFLADQLFQKHVDALRRGWTETEKLEEHERRLTAIKQAIGNTAWTLLEPDSQVELRAFQTIKETWGREHLAQGAYGLCRAFERELRRALERAGNYSREELSAMSWGQLLGSAASRPDHDRLKRVAIRVDELRLKAIRDAAMHPSEWAFTSEKLRTLEEALLRNGLESKGLLRHVVTYRRSERDQG